MRSRNSDRLGRSFSATTVQAVWNKGTKIPGRDANSVRKDACGAIIHRYQYGSTSSTHGWEIDHIMPASKGGPDSLSNLQPLQGENNRHKSDSYPEWFCAVRAA